MQQDITLHLNILETWEGTQWANVIGAGDSRDPEYMEELTNISYPSTSIITQNDKYK